LFTLASPITLYYVALALVLAALFATHRLVEARFGMVLRGCRVNERRMKAMGFHTLRYRLSAYVLSSMLCGVAGCCMPTSRALRRRPTWPGRCPANSS
jgi:branched-chain amino acid transport system permease protein